MKTSLLKKLFANIIALLTFFICIVHTTNGQVFKLVKDIVPGATGSGPGNLINVNGILYFSASNSTGPGLFKSDGTAAGTVKVFASGHNLSSLTNVNGALFFIESYKLGTGLSPSFHQLWKSDGTTNGTVILYPFTRSVLKILGNVNGTLYFVCGTGLYKSDGTVPGTVLVKNFIAAVSYDPGSYMNMNGTLYFSAIDSAHGDELWKSDGTTVGTVLVKDIYPGGISSNPSNFVNVNGELYFSALDSAHGIELWKSNGTAAGTLLVKDIYPGSNGNGIPYNNSYPRYLTNVNGTLYFSATDSAHGFEIWKSDGTAAGTVLLKDIYPGGNSSNASNLTNVNGTLYFSALDAAHGIELWKSNGTATGTVLVKDIYPGSGGSNGYPYNNSNPSNLTNANGSFYLSATDAAHGTELWKSDGTAAGTVLVQDFDSGTGSGTPGNITVVNSTIFLTALTKKYGTELYSDSTPSGGLLPLTILSFVGSVKNNEANLMWATTNEINSQGFQIEKSIDDKTFSAIGFVPHDGSSPSEHQYSFIDNDLISGDNFYRLKQTDIDGNFTYSKVIKINNNQHNNITISPNPVPGSTTISFTLLQPQKVSIQIFDMEGRLIKNIANEQMQAGAHQLIWNATDNNESIVAPGIYLLRLQAGNHIEMKKLFVVK